VFSPGGHPDQALIEYRVRFDPVFETISYQGVPDVRIVVFQGIRVMSMVRPPTRMSDGKANLHQGDMGAGIDLASGRTLTAVWRNDIVDEHPDTGYPVTGVEIPFGIDCWSWRPDATSSPGSDTWGWGWIWSWTGTWIR
jgi:alpha-L-glutamate ligase-like protein